MSGAIIIIVNSTPSITTFFIYLFSQLFRFSVQGSANPQTSVPRKLVEKFAFFCLLQAGEHNFLSSYSQNLAFVDLPIPVESPEQEILLQLDILL